MGLAGKSLTVLTPMYNSQLFMNYHESLVELAANSARSGMKSFSYVNVASAMLTLSRNILTTKFLETDGTHAVFIDADLGFDYRDVLTMLELDLDVIGGCCPVKSISWNRIQRMCRRSTRDYTAEELQELGGKFNFESKIEGRLRVDTPQEVKRLGLGLMMVKRGVFERHVQAYPDRWYESLDRDRGGPLFGGGRVHEFFGMGLNARHEFLGEDYAFCDDCSALGFKIWMCPWTKTTHMGTHNYIGDFGAIARLTGETPQGG
jgi:hypothetical protein